MKSISAVINAQLSDTHCPDKLIRPFAGSTLIDIALNKINGLSCFAQRYLAACEVPLLDKKSSYPQVEKLERSPESTAPDAAPKTAFAHYSQIESDWIFILNPSMPFVSTKTIEKAYQYAQDNDYPSYTSAVPSRDWIFDEANNALTNSDPTNVTTNVGQLFFRAAHAFHLIRKDYFLEHGCFWPRTGHDPHLIEIPEKEAIPVGDEIEFEYAEYAYRKRNQNTSE